ncbi:hypothetical protein CPC16_011925 [Podila verticillata]|nr:hypothetical protein BGZ59_003967 [Podila verticillata]KAF9377230.1 hypothetical protein CPC16_011925 [Podila verticillata]KFH71499.1 hypothetical protein MVEG_01798 [Podila verticillata NRRL 6337]
MGDQMYYQGHRCELCLSKNQQIQAKDEVIRAKDAVIAAKDDAIAQLDLAVKQLKLQLRMATSSSEEKDALTIYIRNVTENMTQEMLLEAFSVFGHIRVLNVVHSKACAFAEFATPEAYQMALSASMVRVGNGQETVMTEMRVRRPHQQPQQQQPFSRKSSFNNIRAVSKDLKVDEGCDVSTNYNC